MRRVGRLPLERLDDHPLDVVVADRARLARPRLVVKTVKTAASETTAPLTDRVGAATEASRDLLARRTIGGSQHDPAAQRQRLRARRTARPAHEHLPLLVAHHDLYPLRYDNPHRRR